MISKIEPKGKELMVTITNSDGNDNPPMTIDHVAREGVNCRAVLSVCSVGDAVEAPWGTAAGPFSAVIESIADDDKITLTWDVQEDGPLKSAAKREKNNKGLDPHKVTMRSVTCADRGHYSHDADDASAAVDLPKDPKETECSLQEMPLH